MPLKLEDQIKNSLIMTILYGGFTIIFYYGKQMLEKEKDQIKEQRLKRRLKQIEKVESNGEQQIRSFKESIHKENDEQQYSENRVENINVIMNRNKLGLQTIQQIFEQAVKLGMIQFKQINMLSFEKRYQLLRETKSNQLSSAYIQEVLEYHEDLENLKSMSLDKILQQNNIDNQLFEQSLDSYTIKDEVKDILKIENKYKKSLKLGLQEYQTIDIHKIIKIQYFFLEKLRDASILFEVVQQAQQTQQLDYLYDIIKCILHDLVYSEFNVTEQDYLLSIQKLKSLEQINKIKSFEEQFVKEYQIFKIKANI